MVMTKFVEYGNIFHLKKWSITLGKEFHSLTTVIVGNWWIGVFIIDIFCHNCTCQKYNQTDEPSSSAARFFKRKWSQKTIVKFHFNNLTNKNVVCVIAKEI